jgi:membrane associated rhomboid family serine protease
LVLEARGIEHNVRETQDLWVVTVPPSLADRAEDEIRRYSTERNLPGSAASRMKPFPGAAAGAIAYVFVLLITAYCAGQEMFGKDWLAAGELQAGAVSDWWRAVTALTLHLDQMHLLGNLLFGVVAGLAVARLFGPGIAWLSILCSGACANFAEMMIAPASHRAIGASTAVFAALGLLAGFAWRQRLSLRERLWYRWAPLIAGICLLTLLGAGDAHVDILGHALGFLFGVAVGWVFAYLGVPAHRGKLLQVLAGAAAASLIGVAWLMALCASVGGPS